MDVATGYRLACGTCARLEQPYTHEERMNERTCPGADDFETQAFFFICGKTKATQPDMYHAGLYFRASGVDLSKGVIF